MTVDILNCKTAIENEIQKELKSKSKCEILGFRVMKGPWEKTWILDAETKEHTASALLMETNGGQTMDFAGPLKVTKKEVKK